MKIGFSSLVCPDWDLETVAARAAEYGYDGVELPGAGGESAVPQAARLADDPGSVRALFAGADIELVCLVSGPPLVGGKGSQVNRNCAVLEENIELASKVGCPFVRVSVGEARKGSLREAMLARVAGELTKVALQAAERRVTVLLENSRGFPTSADLWYLCDSVSHPAIRVCWNPCTAMTALERPTVSIPRLGTKIGMLRVCDGEFDERGNMDGCRIPGTGSVELGRSIELLKGIMYQDYLMFGCPGPESGSLGKAEEVLPQVRSYLGERIDEKQGILSAYKGDKKPVRLKPPPSQSWARPV